MSAHRADGHVVHDEDAHDARIFVPVIRDAGINAGGAETGEQGLAAAGVVAAVLGSAADQIGATPAGAAGQEIELFI
jgi:hypothetical protein